MEGLGINLTENTSWPQAVVMIVGLFLLGFQRWMDRRQVNKVADDAAATRAATSAVHHEVHNNSGSSMRDAIDRIERGQKEHVKIAKDRETVVDARFAKIEARLGIN